MREILIVTVPGNISAESRTALRNYVAESLRTGVLVLGVDETWEVANLPELGGAVVQGLQPDKKRDCPGQEPPKEDKETSHFSGPGAREKRRIYDRLRQYRAGNGLGCLTVLSDVSGGTVTETDLRDALAANRLPMEVWQRIDKALQAVDEP